jgi:hypothetical protein
VYPDGYCPYPFGFNLADVYGGCNTNCTTQANTAKTILDSLPSGVIGMIYLGWGGSGSSDTIGCDGNTATFQSFINVFHNDPKLFGFYLADDPNPLSGASDYCSAAHLSAEVGYIHQEVFRGANTFLFLANLGTECGTARGPSYSNPCFVPSACSPQKSGDDYSTVGADWYAIADYPCRVVSGTSSCFYSWIDTDINAYVNEGFPIYKFIPVIQTFGNGTWTVDYGTAYAVPNSTELAQIRQTWINRLKNTSDCPAFEFDYSFGVQNSDTAIADNPVTTAGMNLQSDVTTWNNLQPDMYYSGAVGCQVATVPGDVSGY